MKKATKLVECFVQIYMIPSILEYSFGFKETTPRKVRISIQTENTS